MISTCSHSLSPQSVPLECPPALCTVASEPKKLIFLPGAKHNYEGVEDEAATQMVKFVLEVVAVPESA